MSKENNIVTIRIPLELRKQLAKAAARESRSVPGMAVHFLAMGVSHLERRYGMLPPEDGKPQGPSGGGPDGIFPAVGVSHPKGRRGGVAGQTRSETGSGSRQSSHGIITSTSCPFTKGVSHLSVFPNPQARGDNPAPHPNTP